MGVFVAVMAAIVAAACAMVAVVVLKKPQSRGDVAQGATLGVLAGLAPISLVIFLRLSYKTCVVLNVLGLPWAEPWREIAHWGAGAVWLASTVFLIYALVTPRLRRAGIAMLVWSLVITIPTFLLYVMIMYGDPAAGCVPA